MARPRREISPRPSAPKFHQDRSAYPAALQGWFARRDPALEDVEISDLDIPVATGFSNETVLFTVGWTTQGKRHRERFVARIEPRDGGIFPVQTPAAEVSVAVQYGIMEAVHANSACPLPPLVGYEPDPGILGAPFFIMGFVPGVVPGDQPRYSVHGFLVDEASPDQRRRLVESGLGVLAAIHRVDWRQAGLSWLDASGRGQPALAHQLALYRRYAATELNGRRHPVLAAALDWLDDHDPQDERVGLSWGDARLGNIIWQDYQAAAVLDWEACALLPTEADVGWWLMYDRISFDDHGAERMEGFPSREEMIAIYEALSGRTVRAAHFWEVFGVMRFCAIFIRLVDRMVSAGLISPTLDAAVANQVTAALARLLQIDNPTPVPPR